MDETTSAVRRRRGRTRSAAGSLAAGLLVLVGCSTTIDGRAAVGESVIAKPSTTLSGPTAGSSRSSDSSTGSPTSGAEDPQTSDDTSDAPTSDSSPTTSGPSGTSGADPATTTAPATSPPASSPGSVDITTATADPGDQSLTAPGTVLAFGASARLPFAYADAEGVFTVNGLTVTRGSEADWAALGVDTADAQGEEPWYLRMSLTQESGGDFAFTSVQDDMWAYTAEGDYISAIYPDDVENDLCPADYAPEGFSVGDSYDTCVVLAVNLGESVDHVQFEGGYDPDDPYFENPVVWKN